MRPQGGDQKVTTRHTWIAGRTTPSRRCWAPRSSASRGACPSSSTIAGGTAAESTWPHKIPSSSGSRCASATPRCAALVLSRASQLPDRSRSAATRRLTFASLWVAARSGCSCRTDYGQSPVACAHGCEYGSLYSSNFARRVLRGGTVRSVSSSAAFLESSSTPWRRW